MIRSSIEKKAVEVKAFALNGQPITPNAFETWYWYHFVPPFFSVVPSSIKCGGILLFTGGFGLGSADLAARPGGLML